MSFAAIFIDKSPVIGGIRADLSVTEEHAGVVNITDNPIEGGGIITDHVQDQPDILVMEIGHSNTPAKLITLDRSPIRHIVIWQKLLAIQKSKLPIPVLTSLKRYRNMLIERVEQTRSKENTNVAIIRLTLRQIEFAFIDDAANLADQAVNGALGEADLGSQGMQAL